MTVIPLYADTAAKLLLQSYSHNYQDHEQSSKY